MDRPALAGDCFPVIDGLAHHAEQAAQHLPAHRDRDPAPGDLHLQIPGQPLRRGQQDAADHGISQMLGDLHDHLPAVGCGI